jgi:hypothetical protein
VRIESAIACYDRVLEFAPDHADARFNRATSQLLLGELAEGFEGYEARWLLESHKEAYRVRDFGRPRWDGSDGAGQTLLLHAQQGLGDTIQFIRFARSVYVQNDMRAAIKREINVLLDSSVLEEKSYADYGSDGQGP